MNKIVWKKYSPFVVGITVTMLMVLHSSFSSIQLLFRTSSVICKKTMSAITEVHHLWGGMQVILRVRYS